MTISTPTAPACTKSAASPKSAAKPHLLAQTFAELKATLAAAGEKPFRVKQVWDWIYDKKVVDPDMMANLPKASRERLKEQFDTALPELLNRLDSKDGSSKLLFKNRQGRMIETVIMRYEGRTSLCVSCQVGCKLACSFCQTGKLGFVAHLTEGEILGQFVAANQLIRDEGKAITHVVFMGMGEPLDNYKNVVPAIAKLISPDAFGLSHRKVTLSTSGMVPKIYQLIEDDCDAALAVSLHAATDALRTELMPINRKYDLKALKDALLHYQKVTGKTITLEFILIKDQNCTIKEAKALVKFIHGLKVKVNLIPFNSHPGLPHQRPSEDEILAFQRYLSTRSIPAPVRYSKGLDISGACGQLAAKTMNVNQAVPSRANLLA